MKLKAFTVLPSAPAKLAPLVDMAYNMWFSWNYEQSALFKKIDRDIWKQSSQNPVRMLCSLSKARLEELAQDEEFLAEMNSVHRRFKNYLDAKTWYQRRKGKATTPLIGYFSLEFGMHESLPIYSGGLGILAGDHVKSASDIGLPLVGVGLMYRQGYFQQYLNAEGMQQELYPENDWYSLPVRNIKNAQGEPLILTLPTDHETINFQIWQVNVGRVSLYLLDANVPGNTDKIRNITMRLYEADREVRLLQEFLLGVGGVQALQAMNIQPSVFHINEGHSAFLMLERIRVLMKNHGLTFEEARQATWGANIFTTHTPVAAGNERFHTDLMRGHLEGYIRQLNISWDSFLSLGRENPQDKNEEFCLTVLAIHLAAFTNGVSKLHGVVSRKLWERLYPDTPSHEVPIDSITNGIHLKTWMSPNLSNLGLRYLGAGFIDDSADLKALRHIDKIPDKEMWEVHEHRRMLLVKFARNAVRKSIQRRGGSPSAISNADEILDPKALTIGFARRFATYKRGNLLLRNPERLLKMLASTTRPVQFVFAGKAHPADVSGKEVIKSLIDFAKRHKVENRFVFIENYDMNVARHLVQGVDVWLNNPRRPLEASGTSGMKAAVNGSINLSIPDGWWDEAYTSDTGWVIGTGESYDNWDIQDEIESNLLYQALEKEVVPTFYDNRDADGVPRPWVKMMKNSIQKLGMVFNTSRMVTEYYEKYYEKAISLWDKMSAQNFAEAKAMAAWRKKLEEEWKGVEIVRVESNANDVMAAGSELTVKALVRLGNLPAASLKVEVYHGSLDHKDHIEAGIRALMEQKGKEGDLVVYQATITCDYGGRYGYAVRILPGNAALAVEFLPGLMKWSC